MGLHTSLAFAAETTWAPQFRLPAYAYFKQLSHMQKPPAAEYCSRELNGSQPAAHWQYTNELSCCETRTQGITAIWEKNPKFCAQLQLTRSYTY